VRGESERESERVREERGERRGRGMSERGAQQQGTKL
jgi:hypothetical protein